MKKTKAILAFTFAAIFAFAIIGGAVAKHIIHREEERAAKAKAAEFDAMMASAVERSRNPMNDEPPLSPPCPRCGGTLGMHDARCNSPWSWLRHDLANAQMQDGGITGCLKSSVADGVRRTARELPWALLWIGLMALGFFLIFAITLGLAAIF